MVFGTRRWEDLTLSIAGPEAKEMPLSVWGPLLASGSISLFTQGPEANSLTLFIGKDADSSGIMPLYLEVPWATGGPGSTLIQGDMPLFVSSTSGAPISAEASLYISAPLIGSGIGTMPLNVATDSIPTGYPLGVIPASGYLTIAVSGADPGGVGVAHASQTTLFIRVQETPTSTIPLYMERNLAASIPLSIKSQRPSGVMSVAISGAYFQTLSTSLYIQSPTTKGLTTHTFGYLE